MNFTLGNPQGQHHGAILSNPHQRQQAHLAQVKSVMETIYKLQHQQQLHYLVQYLEQSQDSFSKQIDECFKDEGVSKHEQQFMREVRERCLEMKKKNEHILMELFNLKQKISRMMYLSLEKDHSKQAEFNMVQEKIRRTKLDISNKLQDLKGKRMVKKNNQYQKSQQQNQLKYQPIKASLMELKNATEIIDRELIKQREEIKLLVKQLYGDDL